MSLIPWNKPVHSADVLAARARLGGPRRRWRAAMPVETMPTNTGSHMPLDTEVHWSMNIALLLPMLLLLFFLVMGMALS